MKTRKIPMRMCTGCRERRAKKELLRVVRTPEGEVVIDRTGRKNGRGAYICMDSAACLEKAVKTKMLERSLEIAIDPEVYERLRGEMASGDDQR
jgi:predicted RNA-binding protein YlxR (DUF448 family)